MNIQTARTLPTRDLALFTITVVSIAIASAGRPAFGQSGSVNTKPQRGIVGQQAPAWVTSKWIGLPDGKTSLDVADVKGKVTYLYFFQSWCPGCHSSGFPTLKTLEAKFRNHKDVQFVAIQTTFEGHHTNTPDKLQVMSQRYGLKIPFGQSKGTSGTPQIMRSYRSGGTPWVIIIDKQGRVVFNDYHIDVNTAVSAIERLRR